MRILPSIAALALGISLFLPSVAFAQAIKPACTTEPCSAADVGPFLQGISKKCGNVGDCGLVDIETVVANIGNWILGIIGALVFAAYIYGGVMWMTSGGGSEGIKKGKNALSKATMGLIIVFIAYAGIYSLKNALGLKAPGNSVEGPVVACSRATIGQKCGTNSICVQRPEVAASFPPECQTLCHVRNAGGYPNYECKDTSTLSAAQKSTCEAQLCDGGPNMLCCDERRTNPTPP